VRIVAGKFRGRVLRPPTGNDIRPTTDRVRESLFAILASNYSEYLDDTRVLDLFAGTGAMGLEAISRGARFCQFVDNSAPARSLVENNIEALGVKEQTRIMRADATRLAPIGKLEPFDLVFLDPPYGKGMQEKALKCLIDGGWLTKQALAVIEDTQASPPPALPSGRIVDERKFGDTKIWIAMV